MNLQENIQRIKSMMGVINESVSDIKSNLKISSKGNDVELLQDLLGIYKDGNFGKQTKSCVQEFQRKMGIDDDGIVGNITKNKLKDLEDKKVKWVTPDFCSSNSKSVEIIKKVDNPDKKDDSQDKISSVDIIFMGGLDYRHGDENLNQQTKRLKDNLPNKNIISFRYNNPTGVLAAIKKTPEAYVVLFSAGCKYSSAAAKEIKNKYKLFIVEPYNGPNGYSNTVNAAVSNGVPTLNVITGPDAARGMGIVSGSTKTPKSYLPKHWGALNYVTTFIK